MTLKEILAKLEAMGDEKRRTHNAKAWAGNPQGAPNLKQFGCATGDIRALARQMKVNHELALELWKTGNIDAQLLAILLLNPKEISAKELDTLVRTGRFAWVADWLNAYIVKEQSAADLEKLRIRWMEDTDGWAARAGWNLTASRIAQSGRKPARSREIKPANEPKTKKGDKAAGLKVKGASVARRTNQAGTDAAEADTCPNELDLVGLLDRIEKEMAGALPETQWAMNAALANIGIHEPRLRQRAIAIGEKLGIYRDYPVSKGCTSPFAPIWINEMVRRQA